MLTSKWAVGFHDRGLGHGDFGVIVEQTDEVLVPKISRELAEHLVEAHNRAIDPQVHTITADQLKKLISDLSEREELLRHEHQALEADVLKESIDTLKEIQR